MVQFEYPRHSNPCVSPTFHEASAQHKNNAFYETFPTLSDLTQPALIDFVMHFFKFLIYL